MNNEDFDELELDEDFANSCFVAQFVDDDTPHSHSLAYMASILEAKIIGSKRRMIKCEDCVAAFIENELVEDSFIRFKARNSNVMQPCRSTFEICKFVDNYVKSCDRRASSYQSVVNFILRNMPYQSLFTTTNFDSHSDKGHKYEFVKCIVELYMHMKSIHIAKSFTLKLQDQPIRHDYRKAVHRKGQ